MRRTGTKRPTTTSSSTSKTQPTAMQSAASYKGKGQATVPKTKKTVTTKKPSTPKTKAPTKRGFATAADAIAASRQEIDRRAASRKLSSGSAGRKTEMQG